MNRLLTTTAAVSLAIAMPLAGAMAGDAGGSAGSSAGMSGGTATEAQMGPGAGSAGGTTGGSSAADSSTMDSSATTADPAAAIENAGTRAAEITAMTEVPSVELVEVDTASNSEVEAAVAGNEAGIASLRNAIESNQAVMSAISAEDSDFDVASVVAVDVGADGSLTVFTSG